MTIYQVRPQGSLFRVFDYEGIPIGTPFMLRSTAQQYADALNEAQSRHRVKVAAPANVVALAARHQPSLLTAPTLRQKLRRLVMKINTYRQTRIGL